MGDDFERFFESLIATGALKPPADVSPQEMAAAREYAATMWASWAAWDAAHPDAFAFDVMATELEVDIAAGQIDATVDVSRSEIRFPNCAAPDFSSPTFVNDTIPVHVQVSFVGTGTVFKDREQCVGPQVCHVYAQSRSATATGTATSGSDVNVSFDPTGLLFAFMGTSNQLQVLPHP